MSSVVETPNHTEPEPKVVKADVLNAIGQIRESAAKSEGDGRVNVDVAMVVVRALEDELGESPVVQIEPGGVDYARIAALMADDVADMVVKRWRDARAKRPQPEEMAPVPWRFDDRGGCVVDADGHVVAPCGPEDVVIGKAIVEAINAYFSPVPQPPTPAEAAAANAETQIPDTAGYPIPDYDVADIPSFENASVPADPVAEFKAAFKKAVLSGLSREQMAGVSHAGICAVVSILGTIRGLSNEEANLAVDRITSAAIQTVNGIVAERPATQRPAA